MNVRLRLTLIVLIQTSFALLWKLSSKILVSIRTTWVTIKQGSLYQNKVNSLVECIWNEGRGGFRLKRNARGTPLFSCTPNPLSLPFQMLATQATRSPPASLPSITLKWSISKEHNLMVVWFHFHFLHPLCLELYHSGNLALYPAVSLNTPSAIFGCVWLLIGLQDSFLIYLIPQRVAPENFQVIGSRTLLDSVLLMLQLV